MREGEKRKERKSKTKEGSKNKRTNERKERRTERRNDGRKEKEYDVQRAWKGLNIVRAIHKVFRISFFMLRSQSVWCHHDVLLAAVGAVAAGVVAAVGAIVVSGA